jgi:TRAP-type mannitol/chloroaromatic compound transport system permease large subunit
MSWIIFGSLSLVTVYGLAGGTDFVKQLMLGLPLSPIGIIFFMQLVFIVLGMLIDWIGIIFLTIPLFLPVVIGLGFDPIWFGVLFVMNIQMAYLTPPFGISLFYVKAVAPPEVTMMDLIKAVPSFAVIQLICLLIVMFIPQIAIWLPGQMMGD